MRINEGIKHRQKDIQTEKYINNKYSLLGTLTVLSAVMELARIN